ncbi:MAG: ATP-binding cassette domain-containing protein, partial [Legionella sp.]
YPELEHLPALEENKNSWPQVDGNPTTILTVTNVSVHYAAKKSILKKKQQIVQAVDSISFRLQKGRTLALVGESGCGKTSVSRALLRLLPQVSGSIKYHDQEVLDLSGSALRAYRKSVQIIFQDPFSSMNPRMTIAEIIAEGMQAQGMKRAQMLARQKQLLEMVGLASTSLDRYPHQFSGGQRQRICIARALATNPEILICDEPTSALDVSVQAQIVNLLKELQQEQGISYLFITHNMGVVSYIADEVLVMKDGKAVEFGSCEQILHNPQHDYTKKLLSAVLVAV